MKHRIIAAAIALTASLSAHAGDDSEAVSCARTKVWASYAEGWSLRTLASSETKLGETATWKVTLYPGRTYKFLACSGKGVSNLDLILYGVDGEPVQRDATEDGQPTFTYKASALGEYYLVAHVRSLDDSSKPADIAVAITHR